MQVEELKPKKPEKKASVPTGGVGFCGVYRDIIPQ